MPKEIDIEIIIDESFDYQLKTINPYFTDIYNKRKTFEVRKNDRYFKIGDIVKLLEIEDDQYTGRLIYIRITYILDDPAYCKEGFIIFGFSVLLRGKEEL